MLTLLDGCYCPRPTRSEHEAVKRPSTGTSQPSLNDLPPLRRVRLPGRLQSDPSEREPSEPDRNTAHAVDERFADLRGRRYGGGDEEPSWKAG